MLAPPACLAVIACLGASPCVAQTVVDMELVLSLDGSRSIDAPEFALQVEGVALAFRDPEFLETLQAAAPRGVAVTLVQWAGVDRQVMVAPWRLVRDPISAADFAEEVLAAGRVVEPGPTGIGGAILHGVGLIEGNRFAASRRVIDISGDGYNNSGNRPESARDAAVALGVVINGLTVMNEVADLDRYYAARVIGGPGAFVVEARDFQDYAAAFRLKLIREIAEIQLSARTDPTRRASR